MNTTVGVPVSLLSRFQQRAFWVLGGLKGAPKIPVAIVVLTAFMAIFADVITPHPPRSINPRESATPPVFSIRSSLPYFYKSGTADHILGTDRKGRDIFSRLIWGTRVSMAVAGASIALGGGLGTALGLVAGYRGGWVDALIMRLVDSTLAVPSILLALVLAITMGPSFWIVVVVIAFTVWARYARLVRGEALSLKERDFVALARVSGASSLNIMLRHIMPNLMSSVIVLSTLQVGWAILVEASLSFLGAGIPPPTPTWGGMVAEGRNYIETLWWITMCPGIAIMLVVLAFNLFGDWLRDVLDPKLRNL